MDTAATLTTLRSVRQRLDVLEVDLIARLLGEADGAETVVAQVFDAPARQVSRIISRSTVLGLESAATQELAQRFRSGEVQLTHVDAFVHVYEALEPEVREGFLADTTVVALAGTLSVRRFVERLRLIAERCRRQLGIERLEGQKRAVRARTWIDRATGMLRISAAVDPQSAVGVSARLDAAMNEVVSSGVPDTCPVDPLERLDHIRGLALIGLLDKSGSSTRGRPEALVVVDTTRHNEFGEPVVDWGLPVELPMRALEEFFQQKPGVAIVDVARSGKLIDRTDLLDLGRSTRLANRAQRRMLRGFHDGCVVPGCAVPFHRCDIHHVVWWRHGGATDLSNLAPVCPHHHHRIHEDGWVLALDAQRSATVTLPDGSVMATGPPAAVQVVAA